MIVKIINDKKLLIKINQSFKAAATVSTYAEDFAKRYSDIIY